MSSRKETEQEALIRRLREYIEYATATKRFADVAFYEQIIDFIEGEKDENRATGTR